MSFIREASETNVLKEQHEKCQEIVKSLHLDALFDIYHSECPKSSIILIPEPEATVEDERAVFKLFGGELRSCPHLLTDPFIHPELPNQVHRFTIEQLVKLRGQEEETWTYILLQAWQHHYEPHGGTFTSIYMKKLQEQLSQSTYLEWMNWNWYNGIL